MKRAYGRPAAAHPLSGSYGSFASRPQYSPHLTLILALWLLAISYGRVPWHSQCRIPSNMPETGIALSRAMSRCRTTVLCVVMLGKGAGLRTTLTTASLILLLISLVPRSLSPHLADHGMLGRWFLLSCASRGQVASATIQRPRRFTSGMRARIDQNGEKPIRPSIRPVG